METISMKSKRIMSERELSMTISRLAKRIVADGTEGAALVGIKSRGVPLAERLASEITKIRKSAVTVGSMDINLYRDDLTEVHHQPMVRHAELPFSVDGRGIILVDDVLYTGRTIRAALDALVDCGRPRFVRLAVLIDRGWRELPIQAEYVGREVKTTANEVVHVRLAETDGVNEVVLKG